MAPDGSDNSHAALFFPVVIDKINNTKGDIYVHATVKKAPHYEHP